MTWRPLSLAERQLAVVWAGLALGAVALRPAWSWLAPLLRPCLLRTTTGVPCPTCGATRGTLALFEGRIADALLCNPMVTVAVVAFVAGGVVAPMWAWRRGTAPAVPSPLPVRWRLGLVVAVAANWTWVIIHS